jgi:hypothetical protein
MEGAKNLLAGRGYVRLRGDGTSRLITTFPPGYSLALAGLGLFGMDPFTAGHYLNVFIFGANIFLVGLIIYRSSRSILFSLLGSLFILTSLSVLKIHSWVMSEGLYIFVTLSALIALDHYFKKGNRLVLVFAGLLIGYATLIRYLGLAFMAAAYLGVLVISRKPWKQRGLDIALIGMASLLPVGGWFLWNALVSQTLANRGFVSHSIYNFFFVFLDETISWLIPIELHSFLSRLRQRLAIFGLFILVTSGLYLLSQYRLFSRRKTDRKITLDPIPGLLAFYLVSYPIIMFLNFRFLYIAYDDNDIRRYLIPVFIAGVLWVFLIFSNISWSGLGGWVVKGGMLVASLGLIVVNSTHTLAFYQHPGDVFGYTEWLWFRQDLISALKGIEPSRPIITNDYELVYFLSGRPPYLVPPGFDPSKTNTPETEKEVDRIKKMLVDGAVLVVIEKAEGISPAINTLIADLVPWRSFEVATLYVAPPYVK